MYIYIYLLIWSSDAIERRVHAGVPVRRVPPVSCRRTPIAFLLPVRFGWPKKPLHVARQPPL